MTKQPVKSLSDGRYVVIGEGEEQTTWPGLTERLFDLLRELVYTEGQSVTIPKGDAYYLAHIVAAHKALIDANREKRNRVCSAIRQEAEKARKAGK